DVEKGIRSLDVIDRSLPRLPLYEKISSAKINTDKIDSLQIAELIIKKIKVLQTDRLILREMSQNDFPSLCKILQDSEVMYAYEHAFSDEEAKIWLDKQILRYEQYGFGLWAVILKSTGEMIGQCGLTIQECNGTEVLEVGYLFQKSFWHMGYATESAIACKKFAFDNLNANEVFSIIRDNNTPSQNVAKRNGMTVYGHITKHYYGIDMPHIVFRVAKET
ncbi:MAG: GNAT family N-acetyltransferase, partial [Clostridia bacterium]